VDVHEVLKGPLNYLVGGDSGGASVLSDDHPFDHEVPARMDIDHVVHKREPAFTETAHNTKALRESLSQEMTIAPHVKLYLAPMSHFNKDRN
jgi:hypothetical protein